MAQTMRDNDIRLYDIFQGEVASVQTYGVFVRIPSSKQQGLVHISQMSASKVDDPGDICNKGDKVWCKIISTDADGGKIGLSMKVVNQRTGQDTDPNQVQTSLDEQKRKTGFKRGISKIELDAVLHTTCRKCGGKGHLAQDCFHTPGGQVYDLVEEDQEEPAPAPVHSKPDRTDYSPKHKKRKKEKKKHKKHDSSSDSDDRSHKKHHKKKEKQKRHDSEESKHKKKKREKLKKKKSEDWKS